jgi:multiple sugar transport system permease protein
VSLIKRNKLHSFIINTLTIIVLMVFLLPFIWLIITSFKNPADIWARPPIWIFKPTLDNYMNVVFEKQLPLYTMNSIIIATVTTLFAVAFGFPAAYSMARFKTGGKALYFDYLTFFMFPPIVVAIPLFLLMKNVGLVDTRIGVVLAHLTFSIPFVVLMMRGIFLDTPLEVEEAALIDGCTRLQAFLKVVIPLAKPGIVASAILVFIFSWNELLFALILTYSRSPTVPILASLTIEAHRIRWGLMTAIGTMTVIPVVIITFFIRKYILIGFTLGAVGEQEK